MGAACVEELYRASIVLPHTHHRVNVHVDTLRAICIPFLSQVSNHDWTTCQHVCVWSYFSIGPCMPFVPECFRWGVFMAKWSSSVRKEKKTFSHDPFCIFRPNGNHNLPSSALTPDRSPYKSYCTHRTWHSVLARGLESHNLWPWARDYFTSNKTPSQISSL